MVMRQESKGDEAWSNFFYVGLGIPFVSVMPLTLMGSRRSQEVKG